MGSCPDCNTRIALAQPALGEIVVCSGCGADLEVISVEPLTFEVYEQEEK
ncbi:MAG TPA: lysine biosynthesis protein LysW [Candidatus Dormibacteraeota bacterium]|jgi:alpha-aminoadipate carrier protein LysW|nr:lysine biosynthesis protein LysW [Candidatus Dormibacteraeota bacterium]